MSCPLIGKEARPRNINPPDRQKNLIDIYWTLIITIPSKPLKWRPWENIKLQGGPKDLSSLENAISYFRWLTWACRVLEERLLASVWIDDRVHSDKSNEDVWRYFIARFGKPTPRKRTILVRGWQDLRTKKYVHVRCHEAKSLGKNVLSLVRRNRCRKYVKGREHWQNSFSSICCNT